MGNNDFRTAATTTTAHQRREKRTDPLIESQHAVFNLNDLTEFVAWTLEQRGVEFNKALVGRTFTLYTLCRRAAAAAEAAEAWAATAAEDIATVPGQLCRIQTWSQL
jgi:hypothetical protein